MAGRGAPSFTGKPSAAKAWATSGLPMPSASASDSTRMRRNQCEGSAASGQLPRVTAVGVALGRQARGDGVGDGAAALHGALELGELHAADGGAEVVAVEVQACPHVCAHRPHPHLVAAHHWIAGLQVERLAAVGKPLALPDQLFGVVVVSAGEDQATLGAGSVVL